MNSLIDSEFILQLNDLSSNFAIIDQNTINNLKNNIIDNIINKLNSYDNNLHLDVDNLQDNKNELQLKIQILQKEFYLNNINWKNELDLQNKMDELQELLNKKNIIYQQLVDKSKIIYEKYDFNFNNIEVIIDKLLIMNNKIQNLWNIFNEDICNNSENKINNENVILSEYNSNDFSDLFESLNNIDSINKSYLYLQNNLLQSIKNPLLNILESNIFENKYQELIPIKAKFSTEQLMNNYDSLNIDLQKFSQTDFTILQQEEIIDIISNNQLKIKKFQAITRELYNRNLNKNIEYNNLLYNLCKSDITFQNDLELYNKISNFINNNNEIINKWKYLKNILKPEEKLLKLNKEILNIQNILNNYEEYKEIKNKENIYNQIEKSCIYKEILNTINNLKSDNLSLNKIYKNSVYLTTIPENKINQIITNQENILNNLNNNTPKLKSKEKIKLSKKKNLNEEQKLPKQENLNEEEQFLLEEEQEKLPEQEELHEQEKLPEQEQEELHEQEKLPEQEELHELEELPEQEQEELPEQEELHEQEELPEQEELHEQEQENLNEQEQENLNEEQENLNEELHKQEQENLYEKVSTFKDALDKYNNTNIMIQPQSIKTYLCIACNKTLTYAGSKPDVHCKTTIHSKQFIKWVNINKIVI
jgi:hypothetical protein